jgi:hypothetical protein
MQVVYFLLLLVSSGQIVRILPPSFSLIFLATHLCCVGAISFAMALVGRIFHGAKFFSAWIRVQVWYVLGGYFICMSWYCWLFDWPKNSLGKEPLINTGTGFFVGIFLLVIGVSLAFWGGKKFGKYSK